MHVYYVCCSEPESFEVFQTGDYNSSWQSEGETEGEKTNVKTSVYQGQVLYGQSLHIMLGKGS